MVQKSLDLRKANILLTGGHGFIGSYVVDELLKRGVSKDWIKIVDSHMLDLRNRAACKKTTDGMDVVIHLAGNTGGIGKNRDYPAALFYDNAIMGIELMEQARKNKVKKFVQVSTVCAYPKFTKVPFKEDDLWNGYPEETNGAYGIAKRMLLVQAQAYRQQYGFNAIYLLPANTYGPGDTDDPLSSHVIPAIIRKVYEAKRERENDINVWGTGAATREFLFAKDTARGIVMATEKYEKGDPVNLGTGIEISIKELVDLIKELMNFKGRVVWDKTKPDGQPRRSVDTTRAWKEFRFRAKVSLEEGLKRTIEWYSKVYKNGV